MYKSNNFCFICLTHENNGTSMCINEVNVQEELNYFVPEYLLPKSDIPKYTCIDCLETLNTFYKFRRKCLENIVIFNEYVRKLSNGLEKDLTEVFTDVHSKKSERYENCSSIIKNEEPKYGTINDKISVKDDSLYRNQSNKICKNYEEMEQVLIKIEPTSVDYLDENEETQNVDRILIKHYAKTEINEELIIKEDSHFAEYEGEQISNVATNINVTMPTKRKCRTLTIEEKFKLIRDVENGARKKDVANKYGIPPSTVSTIMKNKLSVITAVKDGTASETGKRLKKPVYENVDKALIDWLNTARSQNLPISGGLIKERALEFAKQLGQQGFKASSGWLEKWKRRYVISCRKASIGGMNEFENLNKWKCHVVSTFFKD